MKLSNMEEVDSIIVGVEGINLDDYPNLKVLGCNMTSVEHLPLAECEKRGIKVFTLKGETEFLETITSTAEHAIGLMIALMRNYKLAFYDFERSELQGNRLSGKTLGIIGLGRIGKQVKKIAEALGMKVVWCDKNEGSVGELLKVSDIVTCHLPLEGNEGFFTLEMFRKMKSSALFINTSRSGIIQKGALLQALQNQYISGAAMDFKDDQELVDYSYTSSKLILTDHIGGYTFEDVGKTHEFIIKKVDDYLCHLN